MQTAWLSLWKFVRFIKLTFGTEVVKSRCPGGPSAPSSLPGMATARPAALPLGLPLLRLGFEVLVGLVLGFGAW